MRTISVNLYSEDAEVVDRLAKTLSITTEEALYLIIKFYQLKDPSDIQSIKWKLIKKLKNQGLDWSFLLALRFLYITIGEILRQTNFHVRH